MIKIRWLFVLFFLPFYSFSQGYFNRDYDINGTPNYTCTVIANSTGYIFINTAIPSGFAIVTFNQLDYNGDTVFTNSFIKQGYHISGGGPHSLIRTSDGNYLFCGSSVDSIAQISTFFIKYTPLGDTIWTRKFGGASYDVANAVFEAPNGKYNVICNTQSFGHGSTDGWLLKLSSAGDSLQSFFYGTTLQEDAVNGDLTSDGGMIISGMLNYHPLIVKIDSLGNQQWVKNYNSADDYCFITQLSWGGYIIFTRKITTTDGSQACLIKTDTAGNVIWQKTYGTPDDEYAYCKPIILADGSIVIGGGIDLSTGPGPSYVLKTDSMGNQTWFRTYTLSTVTDNYLYDLKATSDGGFIFAGSTYVTTQDAWVVKIDSLGCEVAGCDGVGLNENLNENSSLKLYPNPSMNGTVLVSWSSPIEAQTLTLLDATGKRILEEKIAVGQTTIQLTENLSSGLYLVRVECVNGILTEKYLVK